MKNKIIDMEDIRKNLEIVHHWISLADNKASFLLAIATLFLSGSIVKLPNIEIFIKYLFFCNNIFLTSAIFFLLITHITSIIITFIKLIKIIKPKIESGKNSSLIYFSDISNMSLEEYKKKIKKCSNKEMKDNLINQIYINSKIAKKKYTDLNYAIYSIIFWIISGLLLIIMLYI